MSISDRIKQNQKLKKLVHFLLIPKRQARPRRWVRWFVNPYFHKHKKGSVIRNSVRLDVLPFSYFEIGEYSMIEDFSTINNGVGPVIIGDHTLIGMSNVIIGPVTIGNHIIFAQNIVVSALNHNYEDVNIPIVDQNVTTLPITIHDDCWIGANSIITAGVTIGKHAIIGGGSVVTKDVPPFSVVVGNPARVIKKYNFEINKWEKIISDK